MFSRAFLSRVGILPTLVVVCLMSGCSGKLTQRDAKRMIEAQLKLHAAGDNKISGAIPGYKIEGMGEATDSEAFPLAEHQPYGSPSGNGEPSKEEIFYGPLLESLSKLGYITVQEEGPQSKTVSGVTLHYPHSRTIRLTPKTGSPTDSASTRDYSTGFSCYPMPKPDQCNIPPLVEIGKDFKISGIYQDDKRAKVGILISWKLTQFGTELKPYARPGGDPYSQALSDYRARWEQFLTSHPDSAEEPATILFEKFDDGWHIVDQSGKSI